MNSNKVNSYEDCINSICMFAKQVNINEVKTPNEIFDETKYAEYRERISEEKIANVIKSNASAIEDWLIYSQNKRNTSSWYFFKKTEKKYLVGFLDTERGKLSEKDYSDPINACARMIKVEMEEFNKRSRK